MSNSIDEAREGYGNKICITRFLDGSIEVQDFGRGIPVDYNKNEEKYNWELLFCEMYAGGKYDNGGDNYEFSLGLNGLGLCATQYASEYMDAEIHTDGYKYTLHFEKGENIGGLKKEKYEKKDTGTRIKWKPDLEVFTDINIPIEYFKDTIKRQAIVNDGVKFILKDQTTASKFETFEFCYNDGIMDYVKELAGDNAFTTPQYWECERKGKDREDLPEYKLKIKAAICFSLKTQLKEYFHNSSFLEHGGAPEKAFRSAFVNQINAYLKSNNKYAKNDGQINIQDVEDCIIFVVSSFSTQTSYENQTKKAITNKFIQEAMTDFFRKQLEVYFIENKMDADKIANQVLINMRARVKAENTAEGRQKQYRPQGLTVQPLPQEISGQSADGNSKHRPGIHSVVHTDLHHCRCQAYHDHIKGCCLRSPLPADHNRPQQHGQYRSQQCKHFVGNNAVSYQKRPQPQSHIPYRHIRIMGRQYHANDSHHRIVMGGAITVCFIIVDPLTETQGEQYRRAQNEDQP